MILCFRCSPTTKRQLDLLLDSNNYKDYSDIISAAVYNLGILETEVSKKGSFLISEQESRDLILTENDVQPHKKAKTLVSQEETTVPKLFSKTGFGSLPSNLKESSLKREMEENIPLNRWLFGQYNKFLPVKVNCRALAHLSNNSAATVLLEKAAEEISESALVLSNILSRHDELNDLKREDAFSTAFPSYKNSEKSLQRYVSQFVANVDGQGNISGLLADLRLIHLVGQEQQPCIQLTKAGWQFAALENPILDSNELSFSQKFFDTEIEFLLEHIEKTVPEENFAYQSILGLVSDGVNTPSELDKVLQERVAKSSQKDLSTSFLSSQRSGAISRMVDLQLIKRVREGVKVKYRVTQSGKTFLDGGKKS